MPNIKLPDGKKIPFSKTIDGVEIAKKISKSLSKEKNVLELLEKRAKEIEEKREKRKSMDISPKEEGQFPPISFFVFCPCF